jgi:hypothetical protein
MTRTFSQRYARQVNTLQSATVSNNNSSSTAAYTESAKNHMLCLCVRACIRWVGWLIRRVIVGW